MFTELKKLGKLPKILFLTMYSLLRNTENMDYFIANRNEELNFSMIVDSGKPGPHLVFNGSIHGHEPAGTEAAIRLHKILKEKPEILTRGKITFILGNPEAYKQNKRFLDENMNRAFFDIPMNNLEGKRVAEIKDFIAKTNIDFLIDFHSVSVGDFKIVFYHNLSPESLQIAEQISNIPIFCEINESVVPNSFMYEAAKSGTKSISIECGNNNDLSSIDNAFNHMLSTLSYFKMLSNNLLELPKMAQKPESVEVYHMIEFIKPDYGFRFLDEHVHTGTEVAKGKTYAESENQVYIASDDYTILLPDKNPNPKDFDAGFLCKREVIVNQVGSKLNSPKTLHKIAG